MTIIELATILLIVAHDRRAYLMLEAKALEDQLFKHHTQGEEYRE